MNDANKYTVSVCITTYNMEAYIARALESVLMQQTDFEVEIVVSDDASTDRTILILEEYKKQIGDRFVILKAGENKGLIENFVKSAKNANGEFIATLDADDYWIDNKKLQKQVDILNKRSDIGFIYTNYYNENEITGKRWLGYSKKHVYPTKDAFFSLITNSHIHMSIPCFRKSVLNDIEMDEFVKRKFVAPDMSFFLALSLITNGYYIPDVTTIYVIRPNSMSHQTDFLKRVQNHKECFRIGDYYINENPVPREIIAKRKFDHNLTILLIAWESRDYKNVQEYVKPLNSIDFLKYNPKALYIYLASKNKHLYKLFSYWVLRRRL